MALKTKNQNTLFLFVKLGHEVNAFSLINNFMQIFLKVTYRSLGLEFFLRIQCTFKITLLPRL